MKVNVNLPIVIRFGDYHEIQDQANSFSKLLNTKIKSKEVAFDGDYYGLFYINKRPNRNEVLRLIQNEARKASFDEIKEMTVDYRF